MKRKLTKIVTLMLSIICLFTCFSVIGCGKPEDSGSGTKVYAYVLKKGFGDEWVNALADEFEKQDWVQEKYPGVDIVIETDSYNPTYYNEITKGERSKYDMMFGNYCNDTAADPSNVDLTDIVYNTMVPGEDIKYIDKLQEGVADIESYVAVDGTIKYGSIATLNGSYGILYNKTRLELLGLEVPNTTDEWFDLMEKVKGMKGQNPHYKKTYSIVNATNGYAKDIWNIWWTQYEGKEGYENFYKGIHQGEISPLVLKQQGRLEALKIKEQCFKRANGYYIPNAAQINSMSAQIYLLQGEGLFHFNGDYFTQEMQLYTNDSSDEIGMMKTPIVSAIADKPEMAALRSTAQSLGKTNDQMLSLIIDEIDAGKTSSEYAGITQEVFDRLIEARSAVVSSVGATQGMICSWSDKIEICADFMRFMATDVAIEAVLENSDFSLAFKSDIKTKNPDLFNNLGLIQKTVFESFNEKPVFIKKPNAFLLGKAGLGPLTSLSDSDHNPSFEIIFGRAEEPLTAQEVWEGDYIYWTENNLSRWNTLLQSAGLA